MRRAVPALIALALAAGCSDAKRELGQARTSRSVLAEWALLAEMNGTLPGTYARQMRDEARSELGATAAAARQRPSPNSAAILALAEVKGDPTAAALRSRVRGAQALEQRLEAR
jgi:hypothetical protein